MDEPPPPPPGAWSRPDLTPPHRRPGIPPAHPHHVPYLQIPPSPAAPASSRSPSAHHSRSLSQPPFFTLDSLPPFSSPSPPPQAAVPAPWNASPSPRSDGLPPLKAHRRSVSDIPYGFVQSQPQIPPRAPRKQEPDWEVDSGAAAGDEFLAACMNFDSMEDGSRAGNSSDYEGESSSFNESGSSEPQRKEGNKRSAGEFTSLGPRHSRSVSVDSFMDKLNFGDVSPSPGPGPQRGQHERSGSMDGMAPDFGNGEFNPAEIKKIMQNDKLSEMAMTDPKKVKRILANRLSAARSKERKTRYISELEHKVQTLQAEATTLSNQVTMLQRDSTGLTHQNNELKFRLQAMESQALLRDALNEQLKAEVDRLKIATGEIGEAQLSNRLNQQIQLNPQMFVQQQLQKQQLHQQHQQQQSAQMYQLQQLQQQQLLHQQNNSVQKTEPNT